MLEKILKTFISIFWIITLQPW